MDNGGFKMLVGNRIKQARKDKNLSQEELGNMIGVTKVSVCGYEKGTRTPAIDTFLDLVNILEIDPLYALGLEKEVVSDNDENYKVRMSSDDIKIIKEIRKNRELYNELCNNPKRTIDIINLKLFKK